MSNDKLADAIYAGVEDGEPWFNAAAEAVRERFVVIDRNDLPAITSQTPGLFGTVHGHERVALNPSWHRDLAMHHLAIAQHRESLPPPVDEEAVRDAVRSLWPEATTSELEYNARLEFARRFLADGWKREVTP